MTVFLSVVGGIALLLLLLYLLAICPGKRRDMAPFDRVPFAHRGLYDNSPALPENSLPAFRRARDKGYGVELDIQFTADRQIVVFHDKDLTRMCGVEKRVDSLTYDELQQYVLLGGEERIPRLADVLEVLQDTPVVCEIKSYGPIGSTALCEAAAPQLEAYPGALCVESFNPFMIRWFRRHRPAVRRGILSMRFKEESEVTPAQGFLLTALLTNFLTRPDFIAFNHEDKTALSFRLCRRLFRATTIAWTIRSHEEEAACRDAFDNVIFEHYEPRLEAQEGEP